MKVACRPSHNPITRWNREAPLSFDTAVALSRALYLQRAALAATQEPAADTFLRLYTHSLLMHYNLTPARWDSLRSYLLAQPPMLLLLQESTLAALPK